MPIINSITLLPSNEKLISVENKIGGYIRDADMKAYAFDKRERVWTASLKMKDESVYNGWIIKDTHERDGWGKAVWEDKTYEGCLKSDRKHKNGREILIDGTVFEGKWKNNQKHGKGRITSQERNIYEGKWLKDKINDHGTIKYSNGDLYE